MTQEEQQARIALERFVTHSIVFIDTCSLMHRNAEKLTNELIPVLQANQKKIIVPIRVVEELEKHINSPIPNTQEAAKRALALLKQLTVQQLVDYRGEESDNFADNVFYSVFAKHRMQHRLLLITQDGDLAMDILQLNDSKSAKGYPIKVKRINRFGFLSNFRKDYQKPGEAKPLPAKPEPPAPPAPQSPPTPPRIHKFKLKTELTTLKETALPVTSLPTEGDTIFADNQPIQLKEQFASGGEGYVYHTNTPYVCKIYKEEKINTYKYEKVKLMLKNKIQYPGICWPIALVTNQHGEFVGYLMPRATGKELQRSVFQPQLLKKRFPDWKKRDTVELSVTILNMIKHLHDRNIILGDINPMNILVVSPKEVYFVDTDSYQIEGFPCPVGTINYTAPEIQRKPFNTFLRSFGNEYFAVASLLFMLMLPGKPPYSQQGGANPVDNIIKMDFSYPLGESSNQKAPDGPWRFMWSHLPYYIKSAFYTTFRKGEEGSTEQDRMTVNEWLGKMIHYLGLLDSGKFEEQDEMSVVLFPTRYKKNVNLEYVRCKICGEEVPEDSTEQGMCKSCLKDGEIYRCKHCGKEMVYTNYAKLVRKAKRHTLCPDCYSHMNEVAYTEHCSDCGTAFPITNGELEFYRKKGYEAPKRCKRCRSKARTGGSSHRTANQPRQTQSHQTQKKRSGKSEGLELVLTLLDRFLS